MTPQEWQPIKRLIEARALQMYEAAPLLTTGPRRGKRALHLGDDVMPRVLEQHPALALVYRQAVGRHAMPSEWQKPRPPASPTPKDQAWNRIERLARAMVATSPTPLTLRMAVARVVAADPSLYSAYERAHRAMKRTDLGRSRRRKLGRRNGGPGRSPSVSSPESAHVPAHFVGVFPAGRTSGRPGASRPLLWA